MSKKKEVHDKFTGVDKDGKLKTSSLHYPPHEFFYDDGEYIVYCDFFLDGNITVKLSKNRMIKVSDVDLVQAWIDENELSINDRNEWLNIIILIINLFEIPAARRTELFQKFRESTIAKLEKSIKAIKWLIKQSEEKWEHLIIERQLLDARLNGNNFYLKELRGTSSGHNKFLYPLIMPLFEKLIDLGYNQKEQCEIVYSLFELGSFDNYADTIEEDLTNEIGLAKIYKIRSKLKHLGLDQSP